jgi:hypothetical protein
VGNVERLQKSVNLLILHEFIENEPAVCGDVCPVLLVGDFSVLLSLCTAVCPCELVCIPLTLIRRDFVKLGTNVMVVEARQFYPFTSVALEPNMTVACTSEVGPM